MFVSGRCSGFELSRISWGICLLGALMSGCGGFVNEGFADRVVIEGLRLPTAFEFMRNGGVIIAEKSGKIRYFPAGSRAGQLVADLSAAVYDNADRGLLGLALDPFFPEQPFIYVSYSFDGPVGPTGLVTVPVTPTFDDGDNGKSPSSSRVSRLQVDLGNPGNPLVSETVLVHDWCALESSHSIGGVLFGPDGALYVSGGEGAYWSRLDSGQVNSCEDPEDEGGSLRAQDLESGTDPVGLHGSLIRIDPMSGAAFPDNPIVLAERRIIAYGLRNPYRFTFRPATSEIWIGDVGQLNWEEINVVSSPTDEVIENFGWPCYEGADAEEAFSTFDICTSLYDSGRATPPFFTYKHDYLRWFADPANGGPAAISGLAFYTGTNYPEQFLNGLFSADYVRNCVYFHSADELNERRVFYRGATGLADLKQGPNGNLFYVSVSAGELHEIVYGQDVDEEREPVEEQFEIVITAPAPATVVNGTAVEFSGYATDEAGNQVPESQLLWDVLIRHCPDDVHCHTHYLRQFEGVSSGRFEAVAHDRPSHIEVLLSVRSAVTGGLVAGQPVRIDIGE